VYSSFLFRTSSAPDPFFRGFTGPGGLSKSPLLRALVFFFSAMGQPPEQYRGPFASVFSGVPASQFDEDAPLASLCPLSLSFLSFLSLLESPPFCKELHSIFPIGMTKFPLFPAPSFFFGRAVLSRTPRMHVRVCAGECLPNPPL